MFELFILGEILGALRQIRWGTLYSVLRRMETEFGGVVEEEVGKEVRNLVRGNRMTVPFHYGCGHCECCLKGIPNLLKSLSYAVRFWIRRRICRGRVGQKCRFPFHSPSQKRGRPDSGRHRLPGHGGLSSKVQTSIPGYVTLRYACSRGRPSLYQSSHGTR
nr:alcohol dehydrogenase catalytic domain-containing protein [Alicyclobacillus shizuokensis]